MAKNASPKKRLFIAKNLIMMLVLAVTITLAVFSWFTQHSSVTASGISVKARAGGIQVADCVKSYDSTGKVIKDGPGVFGGTVSFNNIKLVKDCSGDGETLIVPEFNVTKDAVKVKKVGKEVNTNLKPAVATPLNKVDFDNGKVTEEQVEASNYVQLEFYVRSKNQELFFSEETSLISKTEKNGGSLGASVEGTSKKSEYGNFNVDGLVGAIRVGVVAEPCTSITQHWTSDGLTINNDGGNAPDSVRGAKEKQFLWLPRPDVFLNVSEGTSLTNWTLSTEVKNNSNTESAGYKSHTIQYYIPVESNDVDENNNPLWTGAELHTAVAEDKAVVSPDVLTGIPTLGSRQNITSFSAAVNPIQNVVVNGSDINEKEEFYITKITLNVWIEGADAEARRAMNGGEFDLDITIV